MEFYWSSPAGYFGRSEAHGNVFTVMYPSFLKASLNAWTQTNSSSLGYLQWGKKSAPQGPITEEINGLDFLNQKERQGEKKSIFLELQVFGPFVGFCKRDAKGFVAA